ncbi:hypothetical protein BJX76DRAFT_65434 [Aspergillus varians]
MRPTHTKQCTLPFGFIADILFQIVINGDANTVLALCLLNKTTFDTIKVLEPHICKWFMRHHGIDSFNPLLTLNPWTGKQNALTVHTLVRSLYRHELARRLSLRIIPAVWGPFYDDDKVEMNFEAELKLAKRLERGLHVLFHMADISRDTKLNQQSHSRKTSFCVSKHLALLAKLLNEYNNTNSTSPFAMTFPFNNSKPDPKPNITTTKLPPCITKTPKTHLPPLLTHAQTESETGHRRLTFRTTHLDAKSEIAFHCTLRMLRELLERMLLRHGPKFWHRDTRNEYSVVSWFLLNQGPRSLEKLLLTPQDRCCYYPLDQSSLDAGSDVDGGSECLFSDPLDEYWEAWKDTPNLGYAGAGASASTGMSIFTSIGIGKSPGGGGTSPGPGTCTGTGTAPSCDCSRRIRSWSVKPALFDHRGRECNRAAERYLKEMWGQRHVGLHEAFTMEVFATVL